ncbi:MAG: class I SAM-dependent methyltransferase [Gammaproteobacteria bacterium]|nr:MAG: class I SAM-dependent methyltransferase [Gammaproteobacteria bacterium]
MAEATDCPCPLCASSQVEHYLADSRRDYLQCGVCRLVFVPPHQHLSAAQEKAHYDLHENDPADPGYRKFLSRLATPLLEKLADKSAGLDFGSGPGPTLSLMMAEAGHRVAIFDPYYAPDPSCLRQHYDFITATEVVEHLSRPGEELDRLWSLLNVGGWLGLMTKRVSGREAFTRWHYKNDPTHICFYSRETFGHLGLKWQAEVLYPDADVVLFHKN